jgi:transposase InsO family protein
VDDYSRYVWVFFLEEKGETFGFVRDLVLRLRNERHGDAIRAIRSDNGSEFRTLVLKLFGMTWDLDTSFRVHIRLPKMVLWKGKTEPCVTWLG